MFNFCLTYLLAIVFFISCEEKSDIKKVEQSQLPIIEKLSTKSAGFKIPEGLFGEKNSNSVQIKTLFNQRYSLDEFFLKVFNQTSYWSKSVINKGPYLTFLNFPNQTKEPFKAIIDSKLIVESNIEINRVRFWLSPDNNGMPFNGIIDIFTEPNQKNPLGVWKLKVWNKRDQDEIILMDSKELENLGSKLVYNSFSKNKLITQSVLVRKKSYSGVSENVTDGDISQVLKNDSFMLLSDKKIKRCFDLKKYQDLPDSYSVIDKVTGKPVEIKSNEYLLKDDLKYKISLDSMGREVISNRERKSLEVGDTLKHYTYPLIKTSFKVKSKTRGYLQKESYVPFEINPKKEGKELSFRIKSQLKEDILTKGKHFIKYNPSQSPSWLNCEQVYEQKKVVLKNCDSLTSSTVSNALEGKPLELLPKKELTNRLFLGILNNEITLFELRNIYFKSKSPLILRGKSGEYIYGQDFLLRTKENEEVKQSVYELKDSKGYKYNWVYESTGTQSINLLGEGLMLQSPLKFKKTEVYNLLNKKELLSIEFGKKINGLPISSNIEKHLREGLDLSAKQSRESYFIKDNTILRDFLGNEYYIKTNSVKRFYKQVDISSCNDLFASTLKKDHEKIENKFPRLGPMPDMYKLDFIQN